MEAPVEGVVEAVEAVAEVVGAAVGAERAQKSECDRPSWAQDVSREEVRSSYGRRASTTSALGPASRLISLAGGKCASSESRSALPRKGAPVPANAPASPSSLRRNTTQSGRSAAITSVSHPGPCRRRRVTWGETSPTSSTITSLQAYPTHPIG